MADQKLSALTELAAQPAGDDEVYLRDVSEAAADESKRITVANLIAGAGGDFFDKYREFLSWVSVDGYTTTFDSGGQATPKGWLVLLYAGGTSGYKAYIEEPANYRKINTDKLISVDWIIVFLSNTAQTTFLHYTGSGGSPPSETENHFGFKIINARVWVSSADGSVQEITDTAVDLPSGYQLTTLRAVVNPGTDCKFYVNGVLKATHSTRLPDVADNYKLNMGITTNENAGKTLNLGRVLIEAEY